MKVSRVLYEATFVRADIEGPPFDCCRFWSTAEDDDDRVWADARDAMEKHHGHRNVSCWSRQKQGHEGRS